MPLPFSPLGIFEDIFDPFNPVPDTSWIEGVAVGGILAIIGLMAFKYLPTVFLKFLVGGGLLVVGVAMMLGYIAMPAVSVAFMATGLVI